MDPIGNMLSSINNARKVGTKSIEVPYSNLKLDILKKLKQEKYISNYKEITDQKKKYLKIDLFYENGANKISHLKRISKPSLRRYVNHKQIPTVLTGIGEVIISTSQGVLTGKEAKNKHLGGELICEVY